MDFVVLYIIIFVIFAIDFAIVSFFQSNIVAFNSKFEYFELSSKITCVELINKILNIHSIHSLGIANVNSNHTNYYSFKYKVIKISSNFAVSTSKKDIPSCLLCANNAIKGTKTYITYAINIFFNSLFNLISISFIPLVLILSILNISFKLNNIAFVLLLTISIAFVLGLIFKIIKVFIDYKSTKKTLSYLNVFNERELEMINYAILAQTKLEFIDYFFLTFKFAKLANPTRIFDIKTKDSSN